MPIKLANVNIMSQLTSRGLDNTSSAFVSDIYIYIDIHIYIGKTLLCLILNCLSFP